jgi:DNA-binding NtrC family response regulator
MPAILGLEASPEPATSGASEASLHGKRIYVIDDEADILHSMRALLGVWGVEALTADCAAAADRMFEQHGPPDLLIVDLRLGEDVQGAHLAERLQQAHGDFPILIITGETSSEALQQANERSHTVLRKPIAAEVLRRAIATAVAA